jgi:uncharacterized protein YsxB (DUF464 family)
MVQVSIEEDDQGRIWTLKCSGHAGFDDGAGLDLVCAATSALTGALGIGFSQVLSVPVSLNASDGEFALRLPAEAVSDPHFASAQVLLQTTCRALREMAQHYAGFIEVQPGKESSR